MSKTFNNLTKIEKDALKEIGNIGAGNGATAFAHLLDCRIEMSVPAIEIMALSNVPEITNSVDEKYIAVLLRVKGDMTASILLLFPELSIEYLLENLLKEKIDLNNLNKIAISAIEEIANILSASYLKAISQLTGFSLEQTVPAFAYDMVGAILASALIPLSQDSDYALLIKTNFINEGKKIDGFFFLIPDTNSLEKLLKAIGFA